VRLPFALVVPAGQAPRDGWPVAIFGHGFTGLVTDVFRAAATNARQGIATLATDAVGHGSGPRSSWVVTTGGVTTTVPAYGRGIDLDGDGVIGPSEGFDTPTGAYAAISFRDGLRQTTADLMTLVRAVDRDGNPDLSDAPVTYYGQSLGGIYGTMLGGVDPRVPVLALAVNGGPLTETVRLSPGLRPLISQSLAQSVPPLLNGGVAGFTESLPLKGDPPVTQPAPGALAIQDFLAESSWLNRPGSPETFAPLLRKAPLRGLRAKRVLFQHAVGDQTVPNPTSYTLLAAGDLFDRESLYRNDLTPQRDLNPHSFLFDPRFEAGALPGQRQITEFLTSRGTVVLDPDGPGPVWEVPIRDPAVLLRLNFGS
jgi:dienelactone hydrolase